MALSDTAAKGKLIGELLVDYRKITAADLAEALKLQKELGLRLGEVLIRQGKVSKEEIEWILSKQFDIPFVVVDDVTPDSGLIARFSRDFLIQHRILPLYETDDEVVIVTDDPMKPDVFKVIAENSGKRVKVAAGDGEKIDGLLRGVYRHTSVPVLKESLAVIFAVLQDTAFYRLDFMFDDGLCRIRAAGHAISKNIKTLDISVTKAMIFEAFDVLGVALLFNEYRNESSSFLAAYPLRTVSRNVAAPYVNGIFGLPYDGGIAFTDACVHGPVSIFHSARPVPGYPFYLTGGDAAGNGQTIFTADTAPRSFDNFHVDIALPRMCAECAGVGCGMCDGQGYRYERLTGIYSSEEISRKRDHGQN